MTFDLSKAVQTRDGRKARIICTDYKSKTDPIIALIADDNGKEIIQTYSANGEWREGSGEKALDLINVPETKSYFVPVADGHPLSIWETKNFLHVINHKSFLEIRMCDGKLVDCIQHEVEK